MSPVIIAGLILLIGIVVLLFIGVPVAVAVGTSSFVALAYVIGPETASFVGALRLFTCINSFTLLAIPFFVLAGELMNTGGIAARLVDAAKVLVGRMPASLAQTDVVANALFGSVSGAAVASAAAVGTVMGPRQRAEGYDRGFSAAVNAASAAAGMLLPPSNTLIVYSLVSSTSIATLFMAGYGPGLLRALECMVVVFLYSRKHRIGGGEGVPLKVVGVTLSRALLPLLMIVIVIGGILTGVFTPTESAVIAVLYSLALGMAYRMISLRQLPGILLSATKTTSIVMLLVGVATIMSWVMSDSQIPQLIAEAMLGITESPTLILLLILVLLVTVGTFLDPTSAILIFTPIFLPIVVEFGVDPIHLGLIVVFALSLGTITPPVGNVLFVSAKVAGLRIEPVIAALVPFFIALLMGLVIVSFLPALSLWLPDMLGLLE
ncbi:TRAP transporter large permease [Kocuria palustris]|jgi:tripartite ATP-independent transporter DctM subunit|uniref:TRAP transporter large permease n=1 Tax=Kocuria palustris TaxID=71999 RepID=UPI0019D267E6|nr:TRAP transporter large permease [Kocuria palustris]MBN6753721.1 TRAP transporter large permease [Kocuria palustris]MBN6758625.1 TRAP transporter large permease [Kocuria palustris]MBN6763856.1 TRAP transporter large permease [Kocuria palustris]MBN6783198.1 TRAP transporter large permease [Kocuria palustris]MBN6799744.1 TRAP transporter large permease [Kocuria palustris]